MELLNEYHIRCAKLYEFLTFNKFDSITTKRVYKTAHESLMENPKLKNAFKSITNTTNCIDAENFDVNAMFDTYSTRNNIPVMPTLELTEVSSVVRQESREYSELEIEETESTPVLKGEMKTERSDEDISEVEVAEANIENTERSDEIELAEIAEIYTKMFENEESSNEFYELFIEKIKKFKPNHEINYDQEIKQQAVDCSECKETIYLRDELQHQVWLMQCKCKSDFHFRPFKSEKWEIGM